MQVPESNAIVARPLLAAAFCGIIIVGYFVFILLVTDAKPLMGVML